MSSWTFEIKSWVPAAHGIDAHKRRTKVYITGGGMGLGHGDTDGMIGPALVTRHDDSASVTYTLTS